MLARLALALQNGQLQGIEGIGGQGFGGEGGTIVVDENCTVSILNPRYGNFVRSNMLSDAGDVSIALHMIGAFDLCHIRYSPSIRGRPNVTVTFTDRILKCSKQAISYN